MARDKVNTQKLRIVYTHKIQKTKSKKIPYNNKRIKFLRINELDPKHTKKL